MAEEFEGVDLSDAVFWGVDLSRARFRDVNLTDVSISHARVVNLDIDAFVDRVTINGVDVTQFVNEHDRWYPLRGMLRPEDRDGMVAAWDALDTTWDETIARARQLPPGQLNESVGGEWSFVNTLRHLVFAIDKWFTVPILGAETFDPIGMPNSGSVDFGWPGLDPDANPSLDDVLAVRADRSAKFRDFLRTLTPEDMTREITVLENGVVPLNECVYTVFEEEFEHHRYAVRDLAHLG